MKQTLFEVTVLVGRPVSFRILSTDVDHAKEEAKRIATRFREVYGWKDDHAIAVTDARSTNVKTIP